MPGMKNNESVVCIVTHANDYGVRRRALTKPLDVSHVVQQAGNGFCVAQLAAPDHDINLFQRECSRSDFLIIFRPGGSRDKSLSRKDPHPFIDKTGRGDNVQQLAETPCCVPGFLGKFPARGYSRRFMRFLASGNKLPQEVSHGMAVLADQKHAAVRKDWQHDYGSGVYNHIANRANTAWFDYRVAPHTEDPARINQLASQNLTPFGSQDCLRGNCIAACAEQSVAQAFQNES